MVNANILPHLAHVLGRPQSKNIRKDVFWALSNILAGTTSQIQVTPLPHSPPPIVQGYACLYGHSIKDRKHSNKLHQLGRVNSLQES
jgi:hypothetical protein